MSKPFIYEKIGTSQTANIKTVILCPENLTPTL